MNFLELFKKSNFKPLKYNGKMIFIADVLPVFELINYKVEFVKTNSNWEQGIFFHFKGAHFEINDERESINAFHLWQTESKQSNFFRILNKGKSEFKVWNIWRIENGPMKYGTNGGAMYKELSSNGAKYFCNDGKPDDDFDDLIFEIKWKLSNEEK